MTQTTFYTKNYIGWPPIAMKEYTDPNSDYWATRATAKMQMLANQIGTDDYRLWAEMTWPGSSIDDQTWQQIWDTTRLALEAGTDAIQASLECNCGVNDYVCPVCRADARIREREEKRK